MNNGMSYNINTILRINGLLGHSPVTFLMLQYLWFIWMPLLLNFKVILQLLGSQHLLAQMDPLDMVGQVKIQVTIGNFHTEQVFTVVNSLIVDCSDFLI